MSKKRRGNDKYLQRQIDTLKRESDAGFNSMAGSAMGGMLDYLKSEVEDSNMENGTDLFLFGFNLPIEDNMISFDASKKAFVGMCIYGPMAWKREDITSIEEFAKACKAREFKLKPFKISDKHRVEEYASIAPYIQHRWECPICSNHMEWSNEKVAASRREKRFFCGACYSGIGEKNQFLDKGPVYPEVGPEDEVIQRMYKQFTSGEFAAESEVLKLVPRYYGTFHNSESPLADDAANNWAPDEKEQELQSRFMKKFGIVCHPFVNLRDMHFDKSKEPRKWPVFAKDGTKSTVREARWTEPCVGLRNVVALASRFSIGWVREEDLIVNDPTCELWQGWRWKFPLKQERAARRSRSTGTLAV